MSLIAWYPLNGNLRNIGTDGEDLTPFEGTPTYVDGKTGKAVYFSSNNVNQRLTRSLFLKQNSFSWCVWVKPKLLTTNTVHYAVCNGRADFNLDGWGLGFSQDISTAKVECGSLRYSFTPKLDVWTHVTFTINENNIATIYMNGIKVHQSSVSTLPDFSEGTLFSLGCFKYAAGDIYPMSGCLCDFRYYDHCLTQSGVSEIAKGLMLHYSFENPYAEETINLCTSYGASEDRLSSDSNGTYFNKSATDYHTAGVHTNPISVTAGEYYTFSIEINPNIDLLYDTHTYCGKNGYSEGTHGYYGWFNNDFNTPITSANDVGMKFIDYYKGNIPVNTWTRVWCTVYLKTEYGGGNLTCGFIPFSIGDELKVYYRNGVLEKKNHMTPYTSSNREAGLIRDNSGMGNDGTQVYQREEIPIISSPAPGNGGGGAWDITITENSGTYTITNFNSTDNQCVTLGKINYNSRYHYLNSLVSYEFDITLKNLVMADGKTLSDASSSNNHPSMMQGMVHFKDGTSSWTNNPSSDCFITKRLNDGKTANGTFHICHEKKITNQACLTNASYYDLGFRFNYVKSGTIIISNLHAYYGSLDTSTLSLSDNSAIGTHSAYFNGKNYIDIPDMSLPVGDLTISFWGKYDINNLAKWGRFINFSEGLEDTERLIVATNISNNKLVFHYVDNTDNPELYTPLNKEGWHLYTWIINNTSSKMSLYIDGEFESEEPINVKHTGVLMKENYIGKSSFKIDSNLYGYIDDVRLYSTVLSPKDIKALYNVKSRIDNKSNLYCNQLVETKSENLSDLPNATYNRLSNTPDFTVDYDSISKISTITCNGTLTSTAQKGYFMNTNAYGGTWEPNKHYKYSFYVKLPSAGAWGIGHERLNPVWKNYPSGKWIHISQDGITNNNSNYAMIFYTSCDLNVGDEIQIRDLEVYRLYDDENYNPGPNIKGQYKTFELNEIFNEDVENSGATIVDKYGAEWLEVFYHNCKNDKILFADVQEVLHTNSQYKFSILDQLENFRGADNKFEFLLEYPTEIPNKYNRWKQSDNPVEVQEVIDNDTASTTFANGYEAIHIDWTGQYWGGLLRTTGSNADWTYIDGSVGHTNWHFSIGQMKEYFPSDPHLPGPGYADASVVRIYNDVHLYVRIDNLPNRNEIFRQYKRQTKTKEIIEI